MAITVIIINCLFAPVEQIKCIVVPHKVRQQSCPRQWVTISTGVPQHWWWIWDTATVWTTTTSSWHLHSLQVLYPQHHIDWYYKQWIPRNWTWLNRTTSMLAIVHHFKFQPANPINTWKLFSYILYASKAGLYTSVRMKFDFWYAGIHVLVLLISSLLVYQFAIV